MCGAVLEYAVWRKLKGQALELASHGMTLFLGAWYFVVWIAGIVRNDLSLC